MIHKYSLFGYNIAIDVESGSIHILSDVAFKMLDYLNAEIESGNTLPSECPGGLRYSLAKYESSEVNAAYTELWGLYNEGSLFSEAERLDDTKIAVKDMPLKAICLHISHDCNMKCRYCFASEGSFGMKSSLMSEETGNKAIDFLLANSKGRKNLEVDFFGGEPLMNFSAVKNIVANTREKEGDKNIRFTLTTNGTLLDDESIDFINQNISNIVLSLDGTENTNDNMRRYLDGSGSYADIVPKYQKLVSQRESDYYVRGTFTRNNLNFCADVLHMADLGFEHISVEPVVTEDGNDFSIREQDLPAIYKEYEKLAREIIKRRRSGKGLFDFFHFNIDIDGGPCIYKRIKGCGSGSEYIAVTPEGDIYPCHQFVGNKNYLLGNVGTEVLDKEKMQDFLDSNIITNETCGNCWAKYYCGGGCAANNYNFNGDIKKPYKIACDMEKKRVECAIAIKAVLADNEA